MKHTERNFSGVNRAKKTAARTNYDMLEAMDCGVASDVVKSLRVRGKRKAASMPNVNYDNTGVNDGHEKKYGVRQDKKKKYDRRSIRENPLTEEDFYNEEV